MISSRECNFGHCVCNGNRGYSKPNNLDAEYFDFLNSHFLSLGAEVDFYSDTLHVILKGLTSQEADHPKSQSVNLLNSQHEIYLNKIIKVWTIACIFRNGSQDLRLMWLKVAAVQGRLDSFTLERLFDINFLRADGTAEIREFQNSTLLSSDFWFWERLIELQKINPSKWSDVLNFALLHISEPAIVDLIAQKNV